MSMLLHHGLSDPAPRSSSNTYCGRRLVHLMHPAGSWGGAGNGRVSPGRHPGQGAAGACPSCMPDCIRSSGPKDVPNGFAIIKFMPTETHVKIQGCTCSRQAGVSGLIVHIQVESARSFAKSCPRRSRRRRRPRRPGSWCGGRARCRSPRCRGSWRTAPRPTAPSRKSSLWRATPPVRHRLDQQHEQQQNCLTLLMTTCGVALLSCAHFCPGICLRLSGLRIHVPINGKKM